MPVSSSLLRPTPASPEEARDVSSAVRHGYDLNGGLLRAVDNQVRIHSPESQGLVRQVLARVTQARHGGKPLKGGKQRVDHAIRGINILGGNIP